MVRKRSHVKKDTVQPTEQPAISVPHEDSNLIGSLPALVPHLRSSFEPSEGYLSFDSVFNSSTMLDIQLEAYGPPDEDEGLVQEEDSDEEEEEGSDEEEEDNDEEEEGSDEEEDSDEEEEGSDEEEDSDEEEEEDSDEEDDEDNSEDKDENKEEGLDFDDDDDDDDDEPEFYDFEFDRVDGFTGSYKSLSPTNDDLRWFLNFRKKDPVHFPLALKYIRIIDPRLSKSLHRLLRHVDSAKLESLVYFISKNCRVTSNRDAVITAIKVRQEIFNYIHYYFRFNKTIIIQFILPIAYSHRCEFSEDPLD